jgi:Bacterial Ig domain
MDKLIGANDLNAVGNQRNPSSQLALAIATGILGSYAATAQAAPLIVQCGVADAYTVNAGSNLPLNAGRNLSSNDAFPNGTGAYGGVAVINFSPTSSRGGSVNVASDGQFSYTPPNGNFSGVDTFTYVASSLDSNVVTTCSNPGSNTVVTINVLPVANPESYNVVYQTQLSVTTPGVLGNDLGNALTVLNFSQPSHGSVNVSPTGSFIYMPAGGYAGPDSFTYNLRDSGNNVAMTTVSLNVANPPLVFGFANGAVTTDTPTVSNGGSLRATINSRFPSPLIVKVLNNGLPASGVQVCFAVQPGVNGASASLSAPMATTGADGIASVTATANGISGSYAVVATLCAAPTAADKGQVKATAGGNIRFQLDNDPASVPVGGAGITALLAALLAWFSRKSVK